MFLCSVSAERKAIYSRTTYGSRVDSDAVVLVVNFRAFDQNVGAGTDVEAVCVVAETAGVASRVVNSHASNGQSVAASNAHSLNRCVLDVDIGHSRVGEAMQSEELKSISKGR